MYLYYVNPSPFFLAHVRGGVNLEQSEIMSKLRLFADTASPVTRAVMLLLATNNVPHEFVHISLKDGEI